MQKITILLSIFIFISCEDKKEDKNSIVGTWQISNMGTYENDDCSGKIDDSMWGFISAFGFKLTMTFTDDGKGTFGITMGEEEQIDIPITWDENKSEFCLMGIECVTYKLGDDTFSFDSKEEANCDDENYTDQSSCEASGSYWNEAICTFNEFTKQ